jgi:hypothetical protein
MERVELRAFIWKLSLYFLAFVNVAGTLIIVSVALDHRSPSRPSDLQLIGIALLLYLVSFFFFHFLRFCYRMFGGRDDSVG